MDRTVLSADEVIQQVSEVLPENDGEFIEHVANQVLGRKVRYLEDSLFEYVDED
jgi:hypothetical protein